MQQIEPKHEPPQVEGMLLTPRKGNGRLLSWLMVLLGVIAGIAVLCVLTNRRPMLALLVIAFLGGLLAVALLMKLYQADTSFKMGFLAMAVSGALHLWFRWNPNKS
jgi:hypothetical protein